MNTPLWRKSNQSGGAEGGGGECVEVAALPSGVGVRDSKAPASGHLVLEPERFAALIARIKSS